MKRKLYQIPIKTKKGEQNDEEISKDLSLCDGGRASALQYAVFGRSAGVL